MLRERGFLTGVVVGVLGGFALGGSIVGYAQRATLTPAVANVNRADPEHLGLIRNPFQIANRLRRYWAMPFSAN